jgi:hypothetical protein
VENKNAAALEMKAKQEYSAQMEFLRSILLWFHSLKMVQDTPLR